MIIYHRERILSTRFVPRSQYTLTGIHTCQCN